MQLHQLLGELTGVELRGDPDTEITSVTHDSRGVRPGALFCCIRGAAADGHDFAAQAVAAGAVALLVERPLGLPVTEVQVGRVRDVLGSVAARFHGDPSRAMTVLGVTGTNGKTTTTYLLESIARAGGRAPAVVGTTGVRAEGVALGPGLTTPEATDLQGLLARLRDHGVEVVAMEVSSHALAQRRVDGTWFAVGCFTNLSHDHLDFHGSIERYFEAKASLFEPGRVGTAVVNAADPHGAVLAARCLERGLATVTYADGPRPGGIDGPPADVEASDIRAEPRGTTFTLSAPRWGGPVTVRSPLVGRFNVGNALAAAATALAAGFDLDAVVEGLGAPIVVPGRFERVDAGQDFTVLVDYAHTPDALEHALRAARSLARSGRVIVVFGCGGDRDRAKRPAMGRAAARLADTVYVTSDNPRSEDPVAIAAEILAGVAPAASASPSCVVELDRRAAIARALSSARSGDVVLVAGKGHETGQSAAGVTTPFDDRVVAREELEALLGSRRAGRTSGCA